MMRKSLGQKILVLAFIYCWRNRDVVKNESVFFSQIISRFGYLELRRVVPWLSKQMTKNTPKTPKRLLKLFFAKHKACCKFLTYCSKGEISSSFFSAHPFCAVLPSVPEKTSILKRKIHKKSVISRFLPKSSSIAKTPQRAQGKCTSAICMPKIGPVQAILAENFMGGFFPKLVFWSFRIVFAFPTRKHQKVPWKCLVGTWTCVPMIWEADLRHNL